MFQLQISLAYPDLIFGNNYHWYTMILFLTTIIIAIPWSYFMAMIIIAIPWSYFMVMIIIGIPWSYFMAMIIIAIPGLILWRWLLLLYPGLILSYFVPRHRCMEKEMDLCMALQLSPERCPRTASSGAPVAGKRAPSTTWKCWGGPACGSRRFQGDEKPQTHFWVVVTS